MARVPKRDGQPRRHHRVRRRGRLARHHRRAAATRSWGCAGIENGVTRFHQVRVPAENRLGKEGDGLKIALTTLNAGRLSIPAMCAGAGKWSLKIAREWSAERVQWGRPVGEHEAVASKIAFIAATDVRAGGGARAVRPAGRRRDARTSGSRPRSPSCGRARWPALIADELRADPRRPRLRDGRVAARRAASAPCPPSRCCATCGSTGSSRAPREIMRLLIAREAVDAHLAAAGDLADPGRRPAAPRRRPRSRRSGFYAKWLPQLVAGKGQLPKSYAEFGPLAKHLRFVERTSRKLARHDVLRHGALAGEAGVPAGLPGPDRRHRRRAVRDVGRRACRAEMLRADGRRARSRRRTSSPTRSASSRGCGSSALFDARCGTTPTTATRSSREPVLDGELHLARGRRARPERGHRAVDRAVAGGPVAVRVGRAPLPPVHAGGLSERQRSRAACRATAGSTPHSATIRRNTTTRRGRRPRD